MQMPPIVGVPALAMWTCGPSSRICWPMLFLSSHRMRIGVVRTATHRAMPPDVMREITGPPPGPNRSARAARASTLSSKGTTYAPVLGRLVSLARHEDDVTGPGPAHGATDGRGAVGLDHHVRGPATAPDRTCVDDGQPGPRNGGCRT